MNDTEERILARQVGRSLTPEEMEQVNGSGGTTYSYTTYTPTMPDHGAGVDYEWTV